MKIKIDSSAKSKWGSVCDLLATLRRLSVLVRCIEFNTTHENDEVYLELTLSDYNVNLDMSKHVRQRSSYKKIYHK